MSSPDFGFSEHIDGLEKLTALARSAPRSKVAQEAENAHASALKAIAQLRYEKDAAAYKVAVRRARVLRVLIGMAFIAALAAVVALIAARAAVPTGTPPGTAHLPNIVHKTVHTGFPPNTLVVYDVVE